MNRTKRFLGNVSGHMDTITPWKYVFKENWIWNEDIF